MNEKKLIISQNNKIFPLKLTAGDEVTHIVLIFPKGIFWKDIYEILNNTPSKNYFPMSRIVADHKIVFNSNLWLCSKGTHKHYKYLNHKEEEEIIIDAVVKVFNSKEKKILKLIEILNSIKANNFIKRAGTFRNQ